MKDNQQNDWKGFLQAVIWVLLKENLNVNLANPLQSLNMFCQNQYNQVFLGEKQQ